MANNRENYICLSAMLRAREPHMLTAELAARIIGAATPDDGARLLTDCGYEDMGGRSAREINSYLEQRQGDIIDEIGRLCPDPEVTDLFRLKYDYHNAKVILKSEAQGRTADNLLLAGGRVSTDRLLTCYREGKLILLPLDLSHAMTEAREVLAHTGNPQAADFILDKAYFAEANRLAGLIDSTWVTGYVKLLIDAANFKSSLRSFKLGRDENFLSEVIMEGGTVSRQMILSLADRESVISLFTGGYLGDAAGCGEVALGGSMTAFEKTIDNGIMKYLKSSGLINYGPEVVIAYLGALETEITAVRMILTCSLSGVSAGSITERLRDLYA